MNTAIKNWKCAKQFNISMFFFFLNLLLKQISTKRKNILADIQIIKEINPIGIILVKLSSGQINLISDEKSQTGRIF